MAANTLYLREAGGQLQYSTDSTSWNIVAAWPVGIVNTNTDTPLTVLLTTDITLTDAAQYFIIGSANISFEGQTSALGGSPKVTVSSVGGYPGLVQNGSALTTGWNYVRITNIFVDGTTSTLAGGGGWIGQAYFSNGATGNVVTRSASNGPIESDGGGIVGEHVSGLQIAKSFSLGSIGMSAGGIVGANASQVSVTDSFSAGAMDSFAGGIFGQSASDSTATRVYSMGIIGTSAGGIVGASATACTVTNSYSTGIIDVDGGGIFGANSTSGIAQNDYVAGSSLGGSVFGSGDALSTTVNTYAEADHGGMSWSDVHAQLSLTDLASKWVTTSINTPFKIASFRAAPYALVTETAAKGGSTSAVLGNYNSCSMVSINGSSPSSYPSVSLNAGTGVISTDGSIDNGLYNIVVHCTTLQGGYTTADFGLVVE
jgi:hypothetical protein